MQTLTIKVNDNYVQKLLSLLELFPKNALKVETLEEKKAKELAKHAKAIKDSIDDVKHGRVSDTGIVVRMKA